MEDPTNPAYKEYHSDFSVILNHVGSLDILLDAMGQAVIVTDGSGKIILWNKFSEKLYGWNADEVMGKNIMNVTVPNLSKSEASAIMEKLVIGEIWEGEFRARTKSGENIDVYVVDTPIIDENNNLVGLIGISHDLKTYKYELRMNALLQEKLINAKFSEQLANLTQGISHLFNNLLTGIIGSASILQKISTDEEQANLIHNILQSAEQSKELIRQLQIFSNHGKLDIQKINISELLTNMSLLLKSLENSSRIKFHYNLTPDLWIDGDIQYIERMIVNIVENAIARIDDEGIITISTKLIDVDHDQILDWDINASGISGKYIALEISDTGSGIDKSPQNLLFSQFSSDNLNEASGLGLALINGIVTNHNAGLQLNSVPNKGTTVKVYFPTTRSIQKEERKSDLYPNIENIRIFVAEDNAIVRQIIEDMLNKMHINTIVCNNHEEAIKKFDTLSDEVKSDIDMFIIDFVVNERSELLLCERILKQTPNRPIILLASFVDNVKKYIARSGSSNLYYLPKPFTYEMLFDKLNYILTDKR